MIALRFDGSLKIERDTPAPRREGEALVQVISAGICNTDLEIVKGYSGFHGTLGHEFVGRVVESQETSLIGERVVGEINVGCNECALCLSGDQRHCPSRSVLGIKGRDGAFAEYLSLPARNLIRIPDTVSNRTAVFIEPLAAACQILDQARIDRESKVAVLGDGKLSQMIARALAQTGCDLTVFGKHDEKLDLVLKTRGANIKAEKIPLSNTSGGNDDLAPSVKGRFDVVVEASGSPSGLSLASGLVRPSGTIVLKSTHHNPTSLDMSRIVVNEVTIVGSRCGRFQPAIDLLASGAIDIEPLITATFTLEEGLPAMKTAAAPGTLKVLLDTNL
ncbi:MAG TPA: alcohol dehydrogenase catalytic domain-containing protein [Blastocatellia bacterium]|nr:alcohol dehydrogenase catalytic domain-containing protein [Blastocatellia bacterium]